MSTYLRLVGQSIISVLIGVLPVAAHPAIYYVDYAGGNDLNIGTSMSGAWKHSPGDPASTGRVAATRLLPGDNVLFRGGVAYRGSIRISSSGDENAPIRFVGSAWGTDKAAFDGSDPVTYVPCPSSVECGGAHNWSKLFLVKFSPPVTTLIKFYDQTGPLFLSQLPTLNDPFRSDELDGFAVLPLSDASAAAQGRLHAPKIALLLRSERGSGTPGLSIWVSGNQVVTRPIKGTADDTVLFDAAGINLYANRDGRYALINSVTGVDVPGSYAVLPGGRAVFALRPNGGPLTLGTGRGALDLNGQSHLRIVGFTFHRQTSDAGNVREGYSIINTGGSSKDIEISDNEFSNQSLYNGQGAIGLRNTSQVIVRNNVIESIERGSGIRAGGGVEGLIVEDNIIHRVGRTAIAFLGVTDGRVLRNVIYDIKGVHGNGISLYLDNRRIAVTGNHVFDAIRPMTFHGDKSRPSPGDHQFIIQDNIMVASDDGVSAITSWGANTRDVKIHGNLLIGPKAGALLSGKDDKVDISGNVGSGIIVKAPIPTWQPGNNDEYSYKNAKRLTQALERDPKKIPDWACRSLPAKSITKMLADNCGK